MQAQKSRSKWRLTGGSTALLALFLCDRVWVANLGDCRAVLYRGAEGYAARQLSRDQTPESERRRIQELAFIRSTILENKKCSKVLVRQARVADGPEDGHPGLHQAPVRHQTEVSGDRVKTTLAGVVTLPAQRGGHRPAGPLQGLLHVRLGSQGGQDTPGPAWSVCLWTRLRHPRLPPPPPPQATSEDVDLLPLVSGRGKAVRLLLTMGVGRYSLLIIPTPRFQISQKCRGRIK